MVGALTVHHHVAQAAAQLSQHAQQGPVAVDLMPRPKKRLRISLFSSIPSQISRSLCTAPSEMSTTKGSRSDFSSCASAALIGASIVVPPRSGTHVVIHVLQFVSSSVSAGISWFEGREEEEVAREPAPRVHRQHGRMHARHRHDVEAQGHHHEHERAERQQQLRLPTPLSGRICKVSVFLRFRSVPGRRAKGRQ